MDHKPESWTCDRCGRQVTTLVDECYHCGRLRDEVDDTPDGSFRLVYDHDPPNPETPRNRLRRRWLYAWIAAWLALFLWIVLNLSDVLPRESDWRATYALISDGVLLAAAICPLVFFYLMLRKSNEPVDLDD